MSDDSGDGSSSSSPSSSSATTPPPAASSSSTPFAPSSLPPEALHAQAVRFLTSLRHHSPNSSLESQKEFLRSKGLGEDAIEAALRDAKRPDNLTADSTDQQQLVPRDGSSSSQSGGNDSDEQSAFDQAARAFDDPLHTPLPSIPSRNYPRSPLALYYEEQEARNGSLAAGGDIEAAVRRQEKARRYEVLLSFFRTVSYLFTLGGALTGVAVLLYRSFILPRLVTTLGARSFLLRHHVGLWDNVLGSVRALQRGGAAGAGLAGGEAVVTRTKAKAKAEGEAQAPRKGGERRGSGGGGGGGLKKVQFADEVDGGQLEEHSSAESDPLLPKKVTQMGGSDGKEKTSSKSKEAGGAEGKGEKSDGGDAVGENGKSDAEKEEEEEAKQQELEPIDVCAPIRQSLAALVQKLRQDRAEDAAAAGARATTVEDEDDGAESDGSASLEDDEEEDVEFDPFVEMNGAKDDKAKKRKAGGSSAKKTGGTASKAKKSTSTSTPTSPPAPATTAPSPLYTSLTTFNANLSARLIASSSAARSFGRHNTAFNFGVPAPQQQQNGSASASSGEEKTAELTAQIKAEIRSLKGLMLSRRNFPRANLGVLSAGGREA